jgi:hypothetical protein
LKEYIGDGMSSVNLDLNLNVSGELAVNSNTTSTTSITSLHGTPTTTVRQHVIRALFDGTQLSKITKIVLVDTGGTERDSTTSLSYSVSGNELTIACTISVTASYTIARVRSYADTYLYFDTTVSPQISVSSGDIVTVTLKITASISGTLTYGTASYSMTMVDFGNLAVSVLAGTKSASDLKISGVIFVCQTASYNASPTKNISSDGLTVYFSASATIISADTLTAIEIWAPVKTLWKYSGLSIPLPAGSSVSYSESVSA